MAATFYNYIAGEWVPARSGKAFPNENPATREILHYFPDSSADDVGDAMAAAVKAARRWRALPAPRRAELIFRAGQLLLERKEELAREMTQEMGKVLVEARGDVQEGIDMAFYMAGEGRRLFGQTVPSELPNKFAMSVRVPKGVVGAITPWNFPIAIPCWKLMPALVAGNTVVFKPSQFSPKSAWNLVRVLEEAGLPPGVLNVVFGEGAVPGAALVDASAVNHISFTGSTTVGRKVGVRCAELGKSVHLEMGGKNAIIVMDDADLDLAIDGAVWSAFGTSGQRCTAASRLLVHRAVHDRFLDRLVDRVKTLRLGDGLDPRTDVGPVVNQPQYEKVLSYLQIGRDEGATVAVGGGPAKRDGLPPGYFIEPTIFVDVKPEMRIAQEEIFGPVTAAIRVNDLDEAVAINDGVIYGLSSSVFTQDVNKAFRALERITTGIVYVNAGTIGAEIQLPFGGTRATGNGHREAGQAALETYTEWKTLYIDYSGRLQRAQIDLETDDDA